MGVSVVCIDNPHSALLLPCLRLTRTGDMRMTSPKVMCGFHTAQTAWHQPETDTGTPLWLRGGGLPASVGARRL